MAEVTFNVPRFYARLKSVYDDWTANGEQWRGVTSLCINSGSPDDVVTKQSSIQLWLTGYELPNTLFLFTVVNGNGELHLVATPKLIKQLSVLETKPEGVFPSVFFHPRQRESSATYEEALAILKERAPKGTVSLGLIAREKPLGPFAQGWSAALDDAKVDQVDVASSWGKLLLILDDAEERFVKTSAAISTRVMNTKFVRALEIVVNDELPTTHEKLAEDIDKAFDDARRISEKLDPDHVEAAFPTIVQSGGECEIKFGSGKKDSRRLTSDSVICVLGARYRNYCSIVGRTFIIDPSPQQESTYKLLLAAHQALISKLGESGVTMGDCYQAARAVIEAKDPELLEYLPEEFGHGIGMEFKERAYTFTEANKRLVEPHMAFNVSLGFLNVPALQSNAPKSKEFSMFLADTVFVGTDGVTLWTDGFKRDFKDIRYYLQDAEDEKKQETKSGKEVASDSEDDDAEMVDSKSVKREPRAPTRERELRTSTIAAAQAASAQEELDRNMEQRQAALAKRLKDQLERKFENEKRAEEQTQALVKIPKSYPQGPSQFPPEARRDAISVDTQHETVLFPIFGSIFPVHAALIKNVSEDDQFLRINLAVPISNSRASNGRITTAMFAQADKEDDHAIWVKELLFRIPDRAVLSELARKIKNLRRAFTDKEKEETQQADLVDQEPLVINRRNTAVPRLRDVFIRPNIGGTRRTTGNLEAHINGFRFTSLKSDQNVDILYKNVRHAFIQKARNDHLVIIHFNLKNPILLGKKKTLDVQFCVEVMELSQALDARSARYHNDDIEQERAEKRKKKAYNEAFMRFGEKVKEITADGKYPIDFDTPAPELAFQGVPDRSRVDIMPTAYCLIAIKEPPFFVLSFSDIEIVSLERVQFGLKSFDMVCVPKDYTKSAVSINTIDMSNLDIVKRLCDQCDIKFYTGPTNLLWNQIMAEAKADPKKFHEEQGYWGFLENAEAEDEESGSEMIDEDYQSDDDSDFEESDAYSEGSEGSLVSDAHSSDLDAEDDDGEDWEELEREAQREDVKTSRKRAERGDVYDSDEGSDDGKSRAKKRQRR